MRSALRFLICEGNPSERNEVLVGLGGRPGSVCFHDLLKTLEPHCHVDVVYPADGEPNFPKGMSVGDYDGAVISGSGLNVPGGEDDPRVVRQIDFARSVFEAQVPMFGSCWGLQVAASAAGGWVQASPKGNEMAIARKITLNSDGRGHPLFEGKISVFDQPAIHVDEVTHLPSGSVILAANGFCGVQAASIIHKGGVFWGVQYHPEFDLDDMARLVRRYAESLVDQGFFADEAAASEYAEWLQVLHQNPEREDLSWLLGIDADILDQRVRWREIENWITRLVRPSAQK